MIKKIISTLGLFFVALVALAQQTETVEMADVMRSNGKIYVVVAVITIIFIGLFIYLIRIEGKVRKLEKEMNIRNIEKGFEK